MLSMVLTRLRGLLQRRRATREMEDELRFHVEMETESNIKRGLSHAEARRVGCVTSAASFRPKRRFGT